MLLDIDNWYGFGSCGDGTSSPSFINTFQRGAEESTWETIPQPSWDEMNFGIANGFLDLFTRDTHMQSNLGTPMYLMQMQELYKLLIG